MRAQAGVSICVLALMMIFGCADADFIADCPPICDCKWWSGKKTAKCSHRELNEVPGKLNSEIQDLDLSNNPLIKISPRAFDNVGLCNLKKLWLHNCKLSTIDKDGFSGLSIITELDVSKNNIKTLHPNTFNELKQLRHLIISENKLERIEDGLFNDLPYLQMIDLRHNYISKLGKNSFSKLPRLITIYLQFNSLSTAEPGNLIKLESMASLVLHENPWKCDCNLGSFRHWVIFHNLDTGQTACAEPEGLRNRLWIELTSEDFACSPKKNDKVEKSNMETQTEIDETVSLNSNNLSRTSVASTRDQGGETDWKSLTLFISVMVIAVLIILIIVLFYFFNYCIQRNSNRLNKLNMQYSDGITLEEVSDEHKMQKSLVTTLNLCNKPLKKYNMPTIVTSGVTETSMVKEGLLNKDTVYASNEDVSRSLFLSDHHLKRARETVSAESLRANVRALYSPTLSLIPPSGGESSPEPRSLLTESSSSQIPLQVQAHRSLNSSTNLYENLPYSHAQISVPDSEGIYDNIKIKKTPDGNPVPFFQTKQGYSDSLSLQ